MKMYVLLTAVNQKVHTQNHKSGTDCYSYLVMKSTSHMTQMHNDARGLQHLAKLHCRHKFL